MNDSLQQHCIILPDPPPLPPPSVTLGGAPNGGPYPLPKFPICGFILRANLTHPVLSCNRQPRRERACHKKTKTIPKKTPKKTKEETPKKIKHHDKNATTWRRLGRRSVATAFFCVVFPGFLFFLVSLFCFGVCYRIFLFFGGTTLSL